MARLPAITQWSSLLGVSIVLAAVLEVAGLPAALLMGPMMAGVIFGTNGATVRVPRLPYFGAQAIVGCLIARTMTADIIATFLKDWPLFLGVVLAVVLASAVLGWLMSRLQVLPGTTAVWGSSPGAATAMMVVAEAFGADARLVAFMQYLRVVFVAIAASIFGRFWVDTSNAVAAPIVWFPPIDAPALAATLAAAGLGALAGRLSRLPAGTFMGPVIAAALLQGSGLTHIELPEWLLAASYALLGWNIGLNFTRKILAHAWRALPQIILSILVLLGFCGALGFILTKTVGIDPLTAYLATSPGGMDSIAIIAASSKQVDVPFVMALQTVRLVIVLLTGPSLARFVARLTMRAEPARPR